MSFTIIPAIDLMGGRCVRLQQGNFDKQSVYEARPVDMAIQYAELGFTRLHLVDLDGARNGAPAHLSVLEEICKATQLQIDFGGGIKTEDQVAQVLNAGAALVTIGSMAVLQPEIMLQWIEKFDASAFWLGADVQHEKLMVHGWKTQTNQPVYEFIHAWRLAGIQSFFCTDIEKDGMLQGSATALYSQILQQCAGVQLYASGGVSTLNDLELLKQMGMQGAIVGKAIYEGHIPLEALAKMNSNA